MRAYRLYTVAKGRITGVRFLEAEDDADAMRQARQNHGCCEVWDQGRFVGDVKLDETTE